MNQKKKQIVLLTALVLFVAVNLYGYNQRVPEDKYCLHPDSSINYDATRLANCFETPAYMARITSHSQTIPTARIVMLGYNKTPISFNAPGLNYNHT